MQTFLEYWAKRKVEVVYEEQPDDWGVDPQMSPDFWERMKEKTLE